VASTLAILGAAADDWGAVGLVWLRAGAELRARWRAALLIVLLVGIGGGVSLTALAGARRADTAMGRFVTYTRPDTASVLFGPSPSGPTVDGPAANSPSLAPYAQPVARLPQVEAVIRAVYLYFSTSPDGRDTGTTNFFAAPDATVWYRVDRPHLVAGHWPAPSAIFDAAVNPFAAQKLGLHVGSTLRVYAYSAAQFLQGQLVGSGVGDVRPTGPSYLITIAGIMRLPTDVSASIPQAAKQDVTYAGQENVYLTPAFLRRLAGDLRFPIQRFPGMNNMGVQLRHGAADWAAFSTAANALGSNIVTQPGDTFGVADAARSAQRGIHLEAVALMLFGGLSALVTLLLAGQAMARQTQLEGADYSVLRNLGASRAQLVGITAVRAAMIASAGLILALLISALGSGLMPIGLARQAEIHPGIEFNAAILVPGALILALALIGQAVIPAWRASPRTAPESDDAALRSRPSPVSAALHRISSPAASVGLRFNLERVRRSGGVPVTAAAVAAVAAVATLTGALTFGASMDHLVHTPRQQGWNWDVLVGNPNGVDDIEAHGSSLLARNPLVASYSAWASIGPMTVEGVDVNTVLAIDPVKGSVYPALLEGRPPRAADEIVLGSTTLSRLHKRVGQTVSMQTPVAPVTLRVVGRMLVPSMGAVLFTNSLGDGAWVSGSLLHKLAAQAAADPSAVQAPPFTLFAVRYVPGASPRAAYDSLRQGFGRTVLQHLPAEDALNLQSVDGLPFILAGLVAVLGIATVGNTIVTSVRRRRRDLAVLKTLGFDRRQVRATVAWQSSSFAVVALAIGIPLGIAIGRWAWTLVASGIDSVSPPLVPTAAVALVVPATLLIGNAVAAWPGRVASRIVPAVAMRAE
jgi:hypothetical protein